MKYKLLHSVVLTVLFVAATLPATAQTVSSTDTTTRHTMRGTYYSDKFVGRKTSSGEVFVQDKYTAAHKTYKFGTLLLVTNPKNGKQVIVRVNDRCPRHNIIDLTRKAAQQIDIKSHTVHVEVLPPRYLVAWEMQDKLLDVLREGRLREYFDKGFRDARQDIGKLFDLELFQCRNLEEAKQRVERLPIFYQDQVEYRPNASSGSVVAVLAIAQSRMRAELVKKELGALFPNIRIVETK